MALRMIVELVFLNIKEYALGLSSLTGTDEISTALEVKTDQWSEQL